MGVPVLIMGKSGSGKSTSLRNFKPDEISVINVLNKPLPFRNKLKTVHTNNYRNIAKYLRETPFPSVAIDDAGYLMTNQFMQNHSSLGAGNAIFQFYNTLADNFWKLIDFIVKDQSLENKIVYIMMHEDKNDFGETKPKTIGKMLDEKICIEGMFTIALRSMISDGRYVFKTNSDGSDVCKTPIGMFDTKEIDNDLKMVDEKIREYYRLNEEEQEHE
nr:MAG TPA: AAA domain protein [Caudoviricetes sp.]